MESRIVFSLLTVLWIALPAAAQGNLTSFSDRSGDRVLYIASSDQHIHQFWLNGTQPVDTDATHEYSSWGSKMAEFGSLASFSDGDGQHNFYIGTDNHVHQIRWSWSTNSGSDLDWTKLTGAPLANGPHLTGFSNARGQHVFYLSFTSGSAVMHIHHLYAVGAGRPIDEDLTFNANPGGACLVEGAIPMTSYSDGSTELVYYVGQSGHICELAWYNGAEGWWDLTLMSGSTPAFSATPANGYMDSPLTGFADANGQNEFYLDANQHIRQLRLSPTGVWSNPDLTLQFGGMPATFNSLTAYTRNYRVRTGSYQCGTLGSPRTCYIYTSKEYVFVSYVDTTNLVHVIEIGPTFGSDQVLNGQLAAPWGYGCLGTSLATITVDAGGNADVYYIGMGFSGDIFKASTLAPLVPGGFGGFGSPADQTPIYGGVSAGQSQGACLIG